MALQIIDHLIPLLKEIAFDSKIIQQVAPGRKKCTSIIKNVVTPNFKASLANTLKTTKFSILIDESTDIGLNKSFCILIRYLDKGGKGCTELLELLKLDSQDCSAEKLFICFKNLLNELDIPLKNVIGVASDKAIHFHPGCCLKIPMLR